MTSVNPTASEIVDRESDDPRSMLQAVVEAGEDFEWYPTTPAMIAAVSRRLPTTFTSLMDIGAGDGRVLIELAKRAEGQPELFAIEKSHILLQAQPVEITPVGCEFFEQNLACLPVDYIFCNPPYSTFETWAVRIIETAFAKRAFLVLPRRWTESALIAAAVARRSATTRVIHQDDFLHAERRARAVIDIVEVSFQTNGRGWSDTPEDPFNVWFNETFSVFDAEEPITEDDAGVDLARVLSLKTISDLVAAFNDDYARMEANYRAIFKLDYALLKELGVKKEAVRDGIKKRMAGLKSAYWELLFEKIDTITSRLSTATKNLFLERLTGRKAIAFTENNAYAVVMWAIRHANRYYDDQLVTLFKELATFEGVFNYKSNQRTWQKSAWRYNSDDHSHFALDYRIVHGGYAAIFKGDGYGRYEYPGNLYKSRHELLDDMVAVLGNLGFPVSAAQPHSRTRVWRSNHWQDFDAPDGTTLFQAKAFMNGNLHLRFQPAAIKALNVEAGRLLGWLREPADVVRELGYTTTDAQRLFGSNQQVEACQVRLLTGATDADAA